MNERELDEEIRKLEGDIACLQFAKNLLCMRLKVLRAARESRKAVAQPAWSEVVREAWKVANGKD